MKNIKYIFLLLFIFITTNYFAQTQIKFRKVIGSNGYDIGYSAKQTFDKGYIVGGSTSSFGAGATDMYLLKTDTLGIPRRQNTFGGINIDVGKCVRQTADSGYVIVGYTNSFGAGGYDVYIVKTNALLDTVWTKTIGGTDWDFANCVEQTTDGGYIICGYTYSYGNGDADYYVIKTTATGDTMWTKTFGGANEDVANSIIQTTDGGYLVTGTNKSLGDTLGDFWTIKLNVNGDTTWTNRWGKFNNCPDAANDILQSRYGGYVLCGETQMFDSLNTNGVIVKMDANGIIHSDSLYRTYAAGFDNFVSVTEDIRGNLGMVGGIANFGLGNGDVFFAQLTKDWGFLSATTYGASQYDVGLSIESTLDTGFIICGFTNSFNNLLSDIYLIKTDTIGLATTTDNLFATNIATYSAAQNTDFIIYPNPANTAATIEYGFRAETIKIYNVLGEEVKQIATTQNKIAKTQLDVADLDNGIYFIVFTSKEKTSTAKLIIEH